MSKMSQPPGAMGANEIARGPRNNAAWQQIDEIDADNYRVDKSRSCIQRDVVSADPPSFVARRIAWDDYRIDFWRSNLVSVERSNLIRWLYIDCREYAGTAASPLVITAVYHVIWQGGIYFWLNVECPWPPFPTRSRTFSANPTHSPGFYIPAWLIFIGFLSI